jgi:hypothetical protein
VARIARPPPVRVSIQTSLSAKQSPRHTVSLVLVVAPPTTNTVSTPLTAMVVAVCHSRGIGWGLPVNGDGSMVLVAVAVAVVV